MTELTPERSEHIVFDIRDRPCQEAFHPGTPVRHLTGTCFCHTEMIADFPPCPSGQTGVTREQIAEATGWPVRYAAKVAETPPPTVQELEALRELHARTARAHGAAN